MKGLALLLYNGCSRLVIDQGSLLGCQDVISAKNYKIPRKIDPFSTVGFLEFLEKITTIFTTI